MEEFPPSWVLLPVSEAVRNVTLTDKKIPQKNYLPSGKFPVFDQGQDYVGGYTDDTAMVIDCELPAIVFGDHTRVVKLVNTAFAPGADGVKVLQPSACILPKLLEQFVRYLVTKIPNNGYARHYQHLAKSLLPIPPLAEQHRIVSKIEELFSELDQGVASLNTAREQLKVYRQSLLKNAFEGKLTAAWRAAHADQLETAVALQQRIARERQARYQQQLADWQTAGQAGPKPKPPKPLPPLTAEELAELPELPAGWGWIRVGELVDRVTVGYVGPMKDEYIEQGVPFLRSQNVRENRFDPEGLKFISEGFHQSLSKSALSAGDVVVVRSGSIGVSCVIPEHLGKANCSDLVIVKAPRHVSSHLLAYYMNWQTQGRVKQKMVGVALIHFNTKSVEGFAYPLCSEQEQQQIEKLLAEKLSEADQLDQTLATALQQADALRQSILKKAFCGQLVKQAKNEEPATTLLERIRAERLSAPPGKKKTRPTVGATQ